MADDNRTLKEDLRRVHGEAMKLLREYSASEEELAEVALPDDKSPRVTRIPLTDEMRRTLSVTRDVSIPGVAPARKPLTLDRIDELWEALEHKAPVYLARAVEREHGIGGGQQ